jgi:hypothetical protein
LTPSVVLTSSLHAKTENPLRMPHPFDVTSPQIRQSPGHSTLPFFSHSQHATMADSPLAAQPHNAGAHGQPSGLAHLLLARSQLDSDECEGGGASGQGPPIGASAATTGAPVA